MCECFIIAESSEIIESRFNTETKGIGYEKNYNLSPGQEALIITCENPKHLQLFKFGMIPSESKKQTPIINVRTEGDRNADNDPLYSGAKGIITKPEFRKLIRSQRCLIIASAFIAGPKDIGLDKPYLVYLQNKKRPFAIAGIYDSWLNSEEETKNGFAIITTTANELLLSIPANTETPRFSFGKNGDQDAFDYFSDVIEKSELYFKKEPQYTAISEKKQIYDQSNITENKLSQIIKDEKNSKLNKVGVKNGFCIRCNAKTDQNPKHPFCNKCFINWDKFKNKEYPEKYCHICGKSIQTTFLKPVCYDCYKT